MSLGDAYKKEGYIKNNNMKEKIDELKKALPRNSYKKIAEDSGLTIDQIRHVMYGHVNDEIKIMKVINEVEKYLFKYRLDKEFLKKKIEKVTNLIK